MRTFSLTLIAAILGLIFSCVRDAKIVSTVQKKADSVEIAFSSASGYFVRNDFSGEGLTLTMLDSKEKLEKVFGYASVMGDGGLPTPVNFENQFVVAAVYSSTELDVKLEPKSLILKNDTLNVALDIVMGQKNSFVSRPFVILIIDGKPAANQSIKAIVNARSAAH